MRGYGRMSHDGKRSQYAHRVSYAAFVGPIPDGLFVCHHCDNPPCVNPAHLFLGAQKDNVDDMLAKGRGLANRRRRQTHCRNGHPLSGVNLSINPAGSRVCVTCRNAAALAWYYRNKSKP